MFLKAGALSLALLLASRMLGLLRESAQAAAFGASGLADAVVLMLTLPDWVAGVLASGALAYVMLPAWAGQDGAGVAAAQRRLAGVLLGSGVALALLMALSRFPVLDLLAAGLDASLRPAAAQALLWSAAAVPLALLASLWTTRLQHERDFAGMYGANLVVNAVLVAALLAVAASAGAAPQGVVAIVGSSLLAAMGLRLLWQHWRQRPFQRQLPVATLPTRAGSLPHGSAWMWGALAAGLPLVLPFAARSIASGTGEGALAVFNYAWKLIELPLMLAIQLVAVLAFPGIARALATQGRPPDAAQAAAAIRPALALAWTLACAAVAVLLWASPLLARVLFGWGRMDWPSLVLVAQWGRLGAWSLLPQALIAVCMVVLAAQGRLKVVVLAHAAALVALLAAARWAGIAEGHELMLLLDALLCLVALAAVMALGRAGRDWLPWQAFAGAGAALLASAAVHASDQMHAGNTVRQAAAAAASALLVLGVAAWASADLRRALRR